MDHLDYLELYTNCWMDLRLFLYSVGYAQPNDYPYADDVLHIMREIEGKYDKH